MKNKAHSDEKEPRPVLPDDGLNNRIEELKAEIYRLDKLSNLAEAELDRMEAAYSQFRREVTRLETDNYEFRTKVVDLHTEIQDKDVRIKLIEVELRADIDKLIEIQDVLKSSVDGVVAVVVEWLDSGKSPLTNLTALVDIANVLDRQDKKTESACIEDSSLQSSDGIPDVVREAVAELERTVRDKLGDPSAKVVAHRISKKQMSELFDITED